MLNRKTSILILALVVIVVAAGGTIWYRRAASGKNPASPGGLVKSIYEVEARNIDGQSVSLDQYRGKTLLIVNVASKCRFTPQYEGLQRLYDKYQSRGLVVLGFPANNFGGQEPGTEQEIVQFCSMKYNVKFPMFAKLSADGSDMHPLYQFLTNRQTNPKHAGPITWNFNKFLIDRSGQPIARFDSADRPESDKVVQAIENALR